MLSGLARSGAKANGRRRAGLIMWSHLLACALLLLPAHALAGAKEKLAALAPSGAPSGSRPVGCCAPVAIRSSLINLRNSC
jgi:hypothetical protein